jgi:hypothetical protein
MCDKYQADLVNACQRGDLDAVRALLDGGANVNYNDYVS